MSIYLSTSSVARLTQIMVSRLVLGLREAGDPRVDVSDHTAGHLSFASRAELAASTQTQVELPGLRPRGVPVSSDGL